MNSWVGGRNVAGYAEAMKSWMQLAYRAILIAAVATAANGSALAGDKPAAGSDLPGVEGNYSIVKPAPPEPEPEQQPRDSQFVPGKWEVTVSGTITFDVTTGKLPPPRR